MPDSINYAAFPFTYEDAFGRESGVCAFRDAFRLSLRGVEFLDDGYFTFFPPDDTPPDRVLPVHLKNIGSAHALAGYMLRMELPLRLQAPHGPTTLPLRLLSPGRAESDIAVELVLDGVPYWTTNKYDLEALLIQLQEDLPAEHRITCCLSCAFGTFSPFGGGGNAIFCAHAGEEAWLKTRNKSDCLEFFRAHEGRMPLRPLTFVCPSYRAIDGETANYSDWQCRILRPRGECP